MNPGGHLKDAQMNELSRVTIRVSKLAAQCFHFPVIQPGIFSRLGCKKGRFSLIGARQMVMALIESMNWLPTTRKHFGEFWFVRIGGQNEMCMDARNMVYLRYFEN